MAVKRKLSHFSGLSEAEKQEVDEQIYNHLVKKGKIVEEITDEQLFGIGDYASELDVDGICDEIRENIENKRNIESDCDSGF